MIEKEGLYRHCEDLIKQRVQALSEAILNTRQAANADTKSSMGDKYETSREMLQQDINRLEKQLSDNNKMLFQLRQCALKQTKLVEVGSLVKTNLGIFFLLVSLGEVYFNMQKVMVISAISPLGKQLLQKKINDSFLLNNMKYEVLDFS